MSNNYIWTHFYSERRRQNAKNNNGEKGMDLRILAIHKLRFDSNFDCVLILSNLFLIVHVKSSTNIKEVILPNTPPLVGSRNCDVVSNLSWWWFVEWC